MAVKKLPSGRWQCQIFPEGRDGKRIRKIFSTKSEALAYEHYMLQAKDEKPWLGETKDPRRLSDLIAQWHSAHGITLGDSKTRLKALTYIQEVLGNPLACNFNARDFSSYREKRLSGELSRTERIKKVKPRTLNLELAYLLAMFNELIRLGQWNGDNPVKNVRPFRLDESEMSYLTLDQIEILLEECKKSKANDLLMIVKICLATGARWSEAENLTKNQIRNNLVTFIKTKGKKNRTIPISQDLFNEINLEKRKSKLFTRCYDAFRSALKRTGIELPAGQLSHVLRHSFASHFMMNGGNILVLQRILGHTDIKLTMRYSHFAPSHLTDAITNNPLSLLENGSKMAAKNH